MQWAIRPYSDVQAGEGEVPGEPNECSNKLRMIFVICCVFVFGKCAASLKLEAAAGVVDACHVV